MALSAGNDNHIIHDPDECGNLWASRRNASTTLSKAMRLTGRRVLMIGAALAVLAVTAAQTTSGQAHRRPCEQTYRRASAAATAQQLSNAISALTRCPDQFPVFIHDAWARAASDSGRFRRFVVPRSGTYEDERVFGTLLSVLRDDGRPYWLRVAAASALLTQVCPTRKLGPVYLFHGRDSLSSFAGFTLEPGVAIPGSQQVQGRPVERFLDALRNVGTSSSELDMRLLARAMIDGLSVPGRRTLLECKP